MTYKIRRSDYGNLIIYIQEKYKGISLNILFKDCTLTVITFEVESMGGFSEDKVDCMLYSFIQGTRGNKS